MVVGEGKESIVGVEDYGLSEREGMEVERQRARTWKVPMCAIYPYFFKVFCQPVGFVSCSILRINVLNLSQSCRDRGVSSPAVTFC